MSAASLFASPKFRRPIRAVAGLALQRPGLSDHLQIRRPGYVLPFFARSNVALTFWTVPDYGEPAECFARDYLVPGDIVVDVGANIGSVAAAAAARVGPTGRVIAIEPHQATFDKLCRTMSLNGMTWVECLNSAVGSRQGRAGLTSHSRKDDFNRVVEPEESGVEVGMCRITDVVCDRGLERIALVKIDVEGFEEEVLCGMAKVMDRVECLHVEAIDHNLKRYASSRARITALLREHRFACFALKGDADNILAIAKTHRPLPQQPELIEVVE